MPKPHPPLPSDLRELPACCARLGITLYARSAPLLLRGKRVHGEWDPLLRRIVLYGVHGRAASELVDTFLHELGHALGGDEEAAVAFARELRSGLAPEAAGDVARELQRASAAATRSPVACELPPAGVPA